MQRADDMVRGRWGLVAGLANGQSVRGGDAYLCAGLIPAPAGAAATLEPVNGKTMQITAGERA